MVQLIFKKKKKSSSRLYLRVGGAHDTKIPSNTEAERAALLYSSFIETPGVRRDQQTDSLADSLAARVKISAVIFNILLVTRLKVSAV